jgi:hypothetical protein
VSGVSRYAIRLFFGLNLAYKTFSVLLDEAVFKVKDKATCMSE